MAKYKIVSMSEHVVRVDPEIHRDEILLSVN